MDGLLYATGTGPFLNKAQILRIADRLEDPSEWIERRVESLTFLDDGTTRRRVSFDFVVPPEFLFLGFIPVAIFRKQDLTALDVRAADGKAISVLTSYDAEDLAIRLLRAGVKVPVTEEIDLLIEEIVLFDSSTMDDAAIKQEEILYGKYLDVIKPKKSADFLKLAQILLRTFILWVQLPDEVKAYQRMIVKVSYEEAFPFEGTFPPRPLQTIVHPNWSSRFHFEVTAPPDLKIAVLTVRSANASNHLLISEKPASGAKSQGETESFELLARSPDGPSQVGHVSMYGFRDDPPAQVDIEIIPSPGGTMRISSMASFCTMLVFLIPAGFKVFGLGFLATPKDGTAAAILLLGPALLVAYLARSPEHPIVAHRLRGARYSLLASGGFLMSAAALLGGIVSEQWLRVLWYLLTGFSASAFAVYVDWARRSRISLKGFNWLHRRSNEV